MNHDPGLYLPGRFARGEPRRSVARNRAGDLATAERTRSERTHADRAGAGRARAWEARSVGIAGHDAHGKCLDAQLLKLRSEFGRDLSRLSTPERSKLDSTCSRLQTPREREAYLDCLHGQLASLSARRSRAILRASGGGRGRGRGRGARQRAVGRRPVDSALITLIFIVPAAGGGGALLITVVGARLVLFVVRARRARHGRVLRRSRPRRVRPLPDVPAQRCGGAPPRSHRARRTRAGERGTAAGGSTSRPKNSVSRRCASRGRRAAALPRRLACAEQEALQRGGRAPTRRGRGGSRAREFQRTQAVDSDAVESALDPYVVLDWRGTRAATRYVPRSKRPGRVMIRIRWRTWAPTCGTTTRRSRAAERAYRMLADGCAGGERQPRRTPPIGGSELVIGDLVNSFTQLTNSTNSPIRQVHR